MSSKKSYFDTDNRQLTDVFRELQETRLQYEAQNSKKAVKTRVKEESQFQASVNRQSSSSSRNSKNLYYVHNSKTVNSSFRKTISISVTLVLLIVAFCFVVLGTNSISAKDDSIQLYSPLSEIGKNSVSIEINRHRLNAHNIITSNAALETVKEQVIEEREIPFEALYTERNTLPKGEEVILQNGINGKKNVTLVRSYENGQMTEENVLREDKIEDFLPQIVDIGTSEFLAKVQAHLKDILYLTKSGILHKDMDDASEELAEIPIYLDVTLLDLPSEEWCKVSYNGIEGYLRTTNLTSAKATPGMPEKNRIQKILLKLNIDMPLNQSSGLTLADYKKIFTGLPNDINNVFKNNYEVFYNMDKKYNINGIFLASLAIHESGWGTSQISLDKKNLFGYGSYDATPYESSYEFDDYKDGIELVAKVMVKYYINPVGTKIYDGEKAVATYYNGSTVASVNIRYASDEDWHTKVYSYMELLYKRLEK